MVVAEGDVGAVEPKEDEGEREEDKEHCTGEKDDEEKVGLVGTTLLDLHAK